MHYFKNIRHLRFKSDLLCLLLLVVLGIIFFWQFFLKNLAPIPVDIIVGIYYPWRDHVWNNYVAGVPFKNGYLSDIVSIIYPWRIYGIELMKSGTIPLWIPHALAGTPLLANFQSGLFYPLNFLFWIFSNIEAWSLYIILGPILASVFCFLYLKNLKISPLGSIFGSVIFGFSGFSLVWLEYGIVAHAGLWLPLALLSVDKLALTRIRVWMVLGSLSIALSFLAGYPQISIFVVGLVAAYAAFKYLKEKSSKFLLTYVFIILGVCLAAVQLIPGFELWSMSVRQFDITTAALKNGISPLKNFILLLSPDFFGNPATGNFWGDIPYNESAFYVGIAGLVFAMFGITSKEFTANFFKAVLLLSVLFVFQTPFASLPHALNLPGFSSASAGRFFYIITFSLAILSAYGVETFLNMKERKKFLLVLGSVFVSLFLLWFIVFVFDGEKLQIAKRNLILPSFMAIFIGLLTLISLKFQKLRRFTVFIIFLIMIFDLFRFGWKYNSFSSKNFLYPETKLTDFMKQQAGIDRFIGLIPQSMFIPYNLFSPEGYDALLPLRFSEFTNQINEEKYGPAAAGSRWVIIHRQDAPLLDLIGVKYLLSFNVAPVNDFDHQEFKFPKKKYRLVFQYGQSQIYENLDALPRTFLTSDYIVIKDKNEILKFLKDGQVKMNKTLILEEEPVLKPQKPLKGYEAKIEESTYFQNKIIIKTKADTSSFLFLSDNYYPGWKAYVDGQETKIFRADYTFRAVFLPEGKHEVLFLFEPKSFKIGLMISLTALAVLGSLLLYEAKKSIRTT